MTEFSNLISNKKQGLTYSSKGSIFRVWAPSKNSIRLAIYKNQYTQFREEYEMVKDNDGCFELYIEGDLESQYYTYLVGENEIADPYSFASSANSKRTAIIDLVKTNPEGFLEHKIPFNDKDEAIIDEVHIADLTISENSGAKNRGLFLGAAESGNEYNGYKTGLNHFTELGVTHIHFLPVTDYITVNELKPLTKYPDNYNWGYDQELYNNIEGVFSTNPQDPYSRIREFKSMVQKYHEKGLSVVLDVVYNHTFRTFDSIFQVLEPLYYYRTINGNFTNGSGCGNELATERPMVRKFIIESLNFLATEYKIDGFRFDLMALIDIVTFNLIVKELREINPNILIYGEPWMALPSPLDYEKQINIGAQKNRGFAIFNPFYRDAIKGDSDGNLRGYIQGEYYNKYKIQEGIAGSIDFNKKESNFASPLETINYFNAHDNLIFHDKLVKSGVSEKKLADLTYVAFAIILTSQGIPFFHAGNSFMRTKYMNDNSYNAPANINGIDWSLKEKNYNLFLKIKDLIKLRKTLKIFNMKTYDEIRENLVFIEGLKDFIIGYIIKNEEKNYVIFHNVSNEEVKIDKSIFTSNYTVEHIFSNAFKNEIVNEIFLERYSLNIYKF